METHEERMARLRAASQQAAAAADAQLAGDLTALQKATQANLAALRPKVQDPAAFDQLVAAVAASSKANESLAQLSERVTKLGAGAVKMANEVLGLLKA